jgi:AraC-type DNA-binding domain-containing proteins
MYELYKDLPLHTITPIPGGGKPVLEKLIVKYGQAYGKENLDLLRIFHSNTNTGMDGSINFMTSFKVGPDVKKKLLYPQGFVLLECGSRYYTERKDCPSFLICYTLDGSCELVYRHKTYRLRKGEGFFIDCREHHIIRTIGSLWVNTALHFDGVQAKDFFDKFAESGSVKFNIFECPRFESIQHKMLLETQKVRPYRDYKVHALLTYMLTLLLLRDGQGQSGESVFNVGQPLVDSVITYINEHFAEPLTIESIGREFGISISHLSREYKRYTGFPLGHYLICTRIENAKLLLQRSDMSIEFIGEAVGFNDNAHFVQIFKKYEGMTPLKFRKREL